MHKNKNQSPVFIMPGLGVDARILQKLDIGDFNSLHWLDPKPKEAFHDYCLRINEQIDHPSPVLIGVSFGGLIMQHIAGLRPIKKVIIISSLKSKDELPLRFKLMKYIPLYQLSRGSWRIKYLHLWARFFGITDHDELQLLKEIFSSFDDRYRMWAIARLCQWEPKHESQNLTHIHGSKDRIFPIRRIEDATIVPKGDHFMIYREAEKISKEIRSLLEEG